MAGVLAPAVTSTPAIVTGASGVWCQAQYGAQHVYPAPKSGVCCQQCATWKNQLNICTLAFSTNLGPSQKNTCACGSHQTCEKCLSQPMLMATKIQAHHTQDKHWSTTMQACTNATILASWTMWVTHPAAGEALQRRKITRGTHSSPTTHPAPCVTSLHCIPSHALHCRTFLTCREHCDHPTVQKTLHGLLDSSEHLYRADTALLPAA